jgi:hypothetical protein
MWLRNLYNLPQQIFTMITASFPPVDDLIINLSKIEYKKHFNTYMDLVVNVCAFVAVISTLIWEKLQVMKFQTPDFISDYFYFSVNLIGEPGDEIVGMSVGNRYIGMYNNTIVWGILNDQGALDS